VPARPFQQVIRSSAELADLIGAPSEIALRKQMNSLDRHMEAFISQSPFLLLATVSRCGACDVSPRGDHPGFVRVLDAATLLVPERAGNRRADSLRNIIETGTAGLLFAIPGVLETLRVNGTAQVVADPELMETMTAGGKRPLVAIAVSVQECFLQCGKALLRSELWSRRDSVALPAFARMLKDQTGIEGMTAEEIDARIRDSYGKLY
jgi:PPOX class probable FMN-dependent enzyme